jgi:hypothetical protein
MLCVRCGQREALPEYLVRGVADEYKAEIPPGLCIGCLRAIPDFRARREARERRLKGPVALLRYLAQQGRAVIARILQGRRRQRQSPVPKLDQDFQRFLQTRDTDMRTLSPPTGLEAMLAFYRDVRADGCDLEQNGDMLLYQWGTHDWGQGPHFELDITRQLILEPGEDENIWQLSLTFTFPPSDSLQALGSGNRWCPSPTELRSFETFVRAHAVYAAVGKRSDSGVDIRFEQAG